jgi:hypothetical protein
MPPQTHPEPADPATAPVTGPPSRVSRRSLLRGAAGVGAIGLVAAGGAAAAAGLSRPDQPAAAATVPPGARGGPLMVYLRDAKTGEMEVFAGTSQVSLRNPALAGQLLRALQ